jgi:hypothetical protein
MKKLVLALSVLTLLAACGKSGGNGDQSPPPVNPQGYAAVDLPPECGGPNQNAVPYEYQSAGCTPYNWDNGHFRHGGCPRRTFAACAAGVGMVCVPQDIYSNYQVAWFNYQDGNRRMQFCGYEGYANAGSCTYRSIPGAGNIGRACLVGGVNECGYGRCQPIGTTVSTRNGRRNRRGGRRGPPVQVRQIGICVQ